MDAHVGEPDSTSPTASIADDRNGFCIFSYDSDQARLPSSSSYIRLLELHPSISGADELDSDTFHHISSLYGSIKTIPIDSPCPFKAL